MSFYPYFLPSSHLYFIVCILHLFLSIFWEFSLTFFGFVSFLHLATFTLTHFLNYCQFSILFLSFSFHSLTVLASSSFVLLFFMSISHQLIFSFFHLFSCHSFFWNINGFFYNFIIFFTLSLILFIRMFIYYPSSPSPSINVVIFSVSLSHLEPLEPDDRFVAAGTWKHLATDTIN